MQKNDYKRADKHRNLNLRSHSLGLKVLRTGNLDSLQKAGNAIPLGGTGFSPGSPVSNKKPLQVLATHKGSCKVPRAGLEPALAF